MRNFVDLHTHSTASDGSLSPAELVRFADRKRLAAVALTDHDTIDGVGEARAAADGFPDLRFVPGIEVSAAFPTGTMHLLGLGIDETAGPIASLSRRLRDAREERNPRILARLRELGLKIDMDDVLAVAREGRARAGKRSGSHPEPAKADRPELISRVHMAEALRRKGCVASADEAFRRYIGSGAPAYVDKERTGPRETIDAIRRSGGLAMLAHPPQLRCANRAQLERILRELIRDGLEGLEVYHGDHTPDQTRHYLDLARRWKLAVTGGSDFHGPVKPDVRLGRPRVPVAAVTEELLERLSRRPRA